MKTGWVKPVQAGSARLSCVLRRGVSGGVYLKRGEHLLHPILQTANHQNFSLDCYLPNIKTLKLQGDCIHLLSFHLRGL